MNRIEIKNFDDYAKTINEFEQINKKIKEIFENQDKNIDKINKTEIWSSKTQESICNKYDELKLQYSDIEVSLDNYVKFMKNTLEEYKKLENMINSDADNNAANLNVN